MGLDVVELVMEVEDAFSIRIPDEEASRMVTVGQLFDYIVAKTNVPQNSSVCLSAIAFYSLRSAAKTLGTRRRIRPRDSTSAIFPDTNRPHYWSQLQLASGLKLPPLHRPRWLVITCTSLVIGCSAVLGFFAYQNANSQLSGTSAAITTATILGAICGLTTRPFKIVPASNCTTLRALAESALAMNFKLLSEQYHCTSKNDLWIALRSIIAEQLDVSPDDIKPSARFVQDLGCD